MCRKSGLVRPYGLTYVANTYLCTIVSGGFATVHPNNTLTINVVEAAPLEDFSPEVCWLSLVCYALTHITHRLSVRTCRRLNA